MTLQELRRLAREDPNEWIPPREALKLIEEIMSDAAHQPRTCGECIHWKHTPQSRGNGAVQLSPQQMGECRAVPPCLQPTPQGAVIIGYLPLPDMFPACDLFDVRPHLFLDNPSG